VNPWLILVCGALLALAFLGHLAAKESARADAEDEKWEATEPNDEYMTGFASAAGSVMLMYDVDFEMWEVTELDAASNVLRVSGFGEFAAAETYYLSVRDLLLEDSARDEVQV
jgi:hypothetical protein